MVGSHFLWHQYLAGLRCFSRSGEISTFGNYQRYYLSQSVDHSDRNENITGDGVCKSTARPSRHGGLFWGSDRCHRRDSGGLQVECLREHFLLSFNSGYHTCRHGFDSEIANIGNPGSLKPIDFFMDRVCPSSLSQHAYIEAEQRIV